MPTIDDFCSAADASLRTLFATPPAVAMPLPDAALLEQAAPLSAEDKRRSIGLMRVNHVGEVCAQALYTAQALASSNATLRAHFTHACGEETAHLAWTAQRLKELGGRPSLLNPLWYAGAFGMGLLAGRLGDAISLGFVEETEKQVGAHLQGHLQGHLDSASEGHAQGHLPENDLASRAVVAQMQRDEAAHAAAAKAMGAAALPPAVQQLMRCAAKVMTTLAQRV